MDKKSDTTSKIPTMAAIVICILIGSILSFVTYIATLNQTRHTVTIEQNEIWIEKCAKSQESVELQRLAKEESDFQKALVDSIIKLQPKLDEPMANRIANEIITECKDKKLDPIIITALIWVESLLDPLAHSNKGAVGLMQVRYKTWKGTPVLQDNGVDTKYKLYWVDLNIKCGTKIFAEYYEESEYNMVKTLHRYNSGSKGLPEGKRFYEIDYANKVTITACNIRESIRKDKEVKVLGHKND